MRLTYDPDADGLTLRLTDAPVESSEEVAANLVLDFDFEGRVVGVEVLFVSSLPDANPMELAFNVYRERAEAAA
jgi:uncharacterized protein YuzE